MEKIYQSRNTKPVAPRTKEEAADAVRHFCRDYCQKDAVSQFHCSGRDAAECEATKNEIVSDFLEEL